MPSAYNSQSQECLKFTQTKLSPTKHVIPARNGHNSIQPDDINFVSKNVETVSDDDSTLQTVLCVSVTKESMTLVSEACDVPAEIPCPQGSAPNSEY